MSNKELIKQLKDKERETQNQLTKLLIYKASDEVKAEKRGERNAYREAIILAKKLKQPQLNENQQIVFYWLKKGYFNPYIKSALSNLYFYVNMTAIGDLENKEIKEMVNAYEKLSHKEVAQVLQAFSQLALEQEEE